MYALEINHVFKKYGSFSALDDVSFNVEEGEFIGLLGVNGAGKTSLISSIAGINRFKGEIKVMGYNVISQVVRAKMSLGVVPQEIAFDPFLTVYQTLKFQAGLYGVKRDKEWLFELLARLHLEDKADTNTRALSGGMKRRLMVAQALVHKPPMIILDEPTAGVDVEIRKSLWGFIQELHGKGHTILLTTHYLEEVEYLCNKIVMINKGKVIKQSTKDELVKEAGSLPVTVELELVQGATLPDSLADILLSSSDNIFVLRLDSTDQLLFILTQLQLANVKLENVNINRPSLEEVFIHYLHR
jgi:ABC-2 type transport system ATP-binding protein